jgi:DNA-directed RNA polymerase subunit RPC12/RpoP
MQVKCPKCSAQVELRPEERDERGRVRVACQDCGAKLLIKVKAPPLRLDDNIPSDDSVPAVDAPDPTGRTSRSIDLMAMSVDTGVDGDSVDVSVAAETSWVVIVDQLGADGISELRRVMMLIPRFKRNPNKLHDLTDELPFVLGGIGCEDATQLSVTIESLMGRCRIGLESELGLNRQPVPEDWHELPDEGLVVAGDEDSDEFSNEVEPISVANESLPLPALNDDDGDQTSSAEPSDPSAGDPVGAVRSSVTESLPQRAVEAIDSSDLVPTAEEADTGPLANRRKASAHVTNGVRLATIDRFLGLDEMIGLVSASVMIPAADLNGRHRAGVLDAALEEAQAELKRSAHRSGAAAVVGVRTTTASLPDGSVLLVMQGTATA